MRTITREVFQFDELSDKAKERARDWWRGLEMRDPAWEGEWRDSAEAAKGFIRGLPNLEGDELRAYIRDNHTETLSGNCPFTGFCADETGLDAVRDFIGSEGGDEGRADLLQRLEHAMQAGWEAECDAAMKDENVDESIRANEYEFYADGRRCQDS